MAACAVVGCDAVDRLLDGKSPLVSDSEGKRNERARRCPECEGATRCDTEAEPPVCVGPRPAGGRCGYLEPGAKEASFELDCVEGTFCNEQGVCEEPRGDGGACKPNQGQCAAKLGCFPAETAGTHTCQKSKLKGEKCRVHSEALGSDRCEPDRCVPACGAANNATEGTCGRLLADGERCQCTEQCLGFCKAEKCERAAEKAARPTLPHPL